jgi:diacylglycerol kinase family enzyme
MARANQAARISESKLPRIFVNPHSCYGEGLSKWRRIEGELRERIGPFHAEEIDSPGELTLQLYKAVKRGENTFLAAGGDGTVHLLLNSLMNCSVDTRSITLGAIGLGSSNDFHKPFREESYIGKVPVRADTVDAAPRDVIRIDYQDDRGDRATRYCLINASLGITAEANALFNSKGRFIRVARKASVDAAILAAALQSIVTYRNIPCILETDEREKESALVSNLGIIKNPHFAGTLCYDTPVRSDDGKLRINLCADLDLGERISMLRALHNRRFKGLPKTRSWEGTQLSVGSYEPFALEMDGEVLYTKRATFKCVPKAVRCCR